MNIVAILFYQNMVIESTNAERVYYSQVNRAVELVYTKYMKVLISYEEILREKSI